MNDLLKVKTLTHVWENQRSTTLRTLLIPEGVELADI